MNSSLCLQCWIAWMQDCSPGSDQSFWQLSQPAALYLSPLKNHHPDHTNSGGVGVLRARVDIQCTVQQEFMKQPRNLLDKILKMLSFIGPITHLDTPSCYLLACRKLVQCYLDALGRSSSLGMTGYAGRGGKGRFWSLRSLSWTPEPQTKSWHV